MTVNTSYGCFWCHFTAVLTPLYEGWPFFSNSITDVFLKYKVIKRQKDSWGGASVKWIQEMDSLQEKTLLRLITELRDSKCNHSGYTNNYTIAKWLIRMQNCCSDKKPRLPRRLIKIVHGTGWQTDYESKVIINNTFKSFDTSWINWCI